VRLYKWDVLSVYLKINVIIAWIIFIFRCQIVDVIDVTLNLHYVRLVLLKHAQVAKSMLFIRLRDVSFALCI
jgi:hypothetical protein